GGGPTAAPGSRCSSRGDLRHCGLHLLLSRLVLLPPPRRQPLRSTLGAGGHDDRNAPGHRAKRRGSIARAVHAGSIGLKPRSGRRTRRIASGSVITCTSHVTVTTPRNRCPVWATKSSPAITAWQCGYGSPSSSLKLPVMEPISCSPAKVRVTY